MTAPTWITTEPPVYRAIKTVAGMTSIDIPLTFEGCAPSATYESAGFVTGPRGFVALTANGTTSIRLHGREVGPIPQKMEIVFAP